MQVIYLDCTNENTYIPDSKRRVKDSYFTVDPNFEWEYDYDEELQPYSLEDCALVRTTGVFPFNHEVHTPLSDNAYDFGGSMYIGDAILDKLREDYPDSYEAEYEKFKIYFENKRNTLHFTVNGLVQTSMYGDFDGRAFIIIEPLKHHIDESLASLRPEDTYFLGNMNLSMESSIIISEEVFERIKDDPRYALELETFNVFVYSGQNQVLAVKEALNFMGYDSFLISNNYYTNGSNAGYPAKEMTDFLNAFALEHGISQASHYYSDFRHEELEKEMERTKEIDYMHLAYILDNSGISDEMKDSVLSAISYYSNYNSDDYKAIIRRVIDEIGYDTLARLTKEFNDMMIKENQVINESKTM